MSFFRISMTVLFLSLLVIAIITSEAADPNYLDHICSNTTTFTPNSTYQSNLNLLLSSLSSKSTNINGFYNDTTGKNPNTVYGLFLCRGDLSTDVCQDCVTFATQNLVQRCPVEKVAIIWYEECLLRYSNRSFFDNLNDRTMLLMYNMENAANQTSFSDLVRATINYVAAQALSNTRKFAVGATNISSYNTLYTLAQCTQDLSSRNCQGCLRLGIGNLHVGKIGSRTLSPSCQVRYQTFLFYNQSAVPASPPSPLSLPPPASGKVKFRTKVFFFKISRSVELLWPKSMWVCHA